MASSTRPQEANLSESVSVRSNVQGKMDALKQMTPEQQAAVTVGPVPTTKLPAAGKSNNSRTSRVPNGTLFLCIMSLCLFLVVVSATHFGWAVQCTRVPQFVDTGDMPYDGMPYVLLVIFFIFGEAAMVRPPSSGPLGTGLSPQLTRRSYLDDGPKLVYPLDPATRKTGCMWRYLVQNGLDPDTLVRLGQFPSLPYLRRATAEYLCRRGQPLATFCLGRSGGEPHIASIWASGNRKTQTERVWFLCGLKVYADEVRSTEAYNATPIRALGGVSPVISSLLSSWKPTEMDNFWTPDTLKGPITQGPTVWARSTHELSVQFRNMFYRHFPSYHNRFPEQFDTNTEVPLLIKSDHNRINTIPANYRARQFPKIPMVRGVKNEAVALAAALSGSEALDAFKNFDVSLGELRFAHERGKRAVDRWETNTQTRVNLQLIFGRQTVAQRQYFEACFRMWSQYYRALFAESIATQHADCAVGVQIHGLPPATVTSYMSTRLIPGVPGQPGIPAIPARNPEDPMWTPAGMNGLLYGTKQFLDVGGLTNDETAFLISCFAPRALVNVPRATIAGAVDRWRFPVDRFTYPNEVDEIFLHYGNQVEPNAAEQAYIRAHVFTPRESAFIARMINWFTARHAINGVMLQAHDAVIYRAGGFSSSAIQNRRVGVLDNMYTNSSFSTELYLPRNLSGFGYYDVYFEEVPISGSIMQILSTAPHEVINGVALANYYRTVSLNWAAVAFSMRGESWDAAANPQAGGYTRELLWHNEIEVKRWNYRNLTQWSHDHARAMAAQYGFCPMATARYTEEGIIHNWFQDHTTPYVSNPYGALGHMRRMPTHQMLPYFDDEAGTSHLKWPAEAAGFTGPRSAYTGHVRLARDTPAFPRHLWMGDGGAAYNYQFLSAFNRPNRFRFEGTAAAPTTSLYAPHWMQTPYGDEAYAAPNRTAPQFMEPMGSPFSDFVVGGFLNSYQVHAARSISWTAEPEARANLTPFERDQLFKLSQGAPHMSLMINYISPMDARVELRETPLYGVAVWRKGEDFAGMTYEEWGDDAKAAPGFQFGGITPAQNPFVTPSARDVPGTDRPRIARSSRTTYRTDDPALMAAKQTVSGGLIGISDVGTTVVPAESVSSHLGYVPTFSYKRPELQFVDELPPMDTSAVTLNANGITVAPLQGHEPALAAEHTAIREAATIQQIEELLAAARGHKENDLAAQTLAAVDDSAAKVDKDFSKYLENSRRERLARASDLGARTIEPSPTSAAPKAISRRSAAATRKFVPAQHLWDPKTAYVRPNVTFVKTSGVKGSTYAGKTLEPNDAVAGGAQATMLAQMQRPVTLENLSPHSRKLLETLASARNKKATHDVKGKSAEPFGAGLPSFAYDNDAVDREWQTGDGVKVRAWKGNEINPAYAERPVSQWSSETKEAFYADRQAALNAEYDAQKAPVTELTATASTMLRGTDNGVRCKIDGREAEAEMPKPKVHFTLEDCALESANEASNDLKTAKN